jgi:hypothetical protein
LIEVIRDNWQRDGFYDFPIIILAFGVSQGSVEWFVANCSVEPSRCNLFTSVLAIYRVLKFEEVVYFHTALDTITDIHEPFGQYFACVGVTVHLPAILEGFVATTSLLITYVEEIFSPEVCNGHKTSLYSASSSSLLCSWNAVVDRVLGVDAEVEK